VQEGNDGTPSLLLEKIIRGKRRPRLFPLKRKCKRKRDGHLKNESAKGKLEVR